MYLTYEQYQAAGGKLTETEFDRYLLAAERKIDRATFDRVINFEVQPERTQKCVRQCAFELVELGADEATANTEKYQSMSNNGVSVSLKERNFDSENNDIINNWLGGVRDANGTALLYAGVSATDKTRQEPVPEPRLHATKVDVAAAGGTATLQDVLTAMDERLYALENK